jgi:hypothetical protein
VVVIVREDLGCDPGSFSGVEQEIRQILGSIRFD